jgi:hypothetical protein
MFILLENMEADDFVVLKVAVGLDLSVALDI